MKNVLFSILLCFSFTLSGQVTGRYPIHNAPVFFEEEGEAVTGHPITHDQFYLSHDNVANGDHIGYVHYLCTDSIFNDRSSGSYSWSIISGNTGSAFAVNSTTGLLTVNNYTAVTGDYTLGVEISHGTDKDTANCEILYASGSDNIFINTDAGTNGDGSYSSPYNNFNAVDDFGELTGGERVFIKRDTRSQINGWQIDNQGNRIYIAAYGTGDKPVIEYSSADEVMVRIGQVGATQNVDDGDSITIMDVRFVGSYSDDNHYAIRAENNSQHNEFHRLQVDSVNNGEGAIYLRGNNTGLAPGDYKIWDCGFSKVDRTNGNRALKIESHDIELENAWFTGMTHPAILAGEHEVDFGSMKYLYLVCDNNDWAQGPVQFRSQACTTEWYVAKNWYYGIRFENYDYETNDRPHPENITIKNGIIEDSHYGVHFWNDDAATEDTFNLIRLENLYITDPTYNGIRLYTSNQTMYFDTVDVTSCLIDSAGDYGIYIHATYNNHLFIQNNIVVGANTYDITLANTLSNSILRNTVYTSVNGLTYFGTEENNYDTDTGDPFVGGGDYQSKAGANTIDTGKDIGREKDILGNDITIQDKGCFEYGGGEYNWTNR